MAGGRVLGLVCFSRADMEIPAEELKVSLYSFLGMPRCCKPLSSFSSTFQSWARQALLIALVADVLIRHAQCGMRAKLAACLGAWLLYQFPSNRLQESKDQLTRAAVVLSASLHAARVRRWTWIWARLPQIRHQQLRQVFMVLLSIDALLQSAGNAAVFSIVVAVGLAATAWLARQQIVAAIWRLWAVLPQPNRHGLHRAMLVALLVEVLSCLARQTSLLLQMAAVILGLLAAARLAKEVALVDGLRALVFLLQEWAFHLRVSTASFFKCEAVEDPWKPCTASWASQMSYLSSDACCFALPTADSHASSGIAEVLGNLGDRSWAPSLPIPPSALKHSAAGVASAACGVTVAGFGAAATCSSAVGSFASHAIGNFACQAQVLARTAAARSVDVAGVSMKVGMATLSSLKASRLAASKSSSLQASKSKSSSKASAVQPRWQKRQRPAKDSNDRSSEPHLAKGTCKKAPHAESMSAETRKMEVMAEAQLLKKGSQKRVLPIPTEEQQAKIAAAFEAVLKKRKIIHCAAAAA